MLMVSGGKFKASNKKRIHFDLNQVRIIIFNVEAISKIHFNRKIDAEPPLARRRLCRN